MASAGSSRFSAMRKLMHDVPQLLSRFTAVAALHVLRERLLDDLPRLALLVVRQFKKLFMARRVHMESPVERLFPRINGREVQRALGCRGGHGLSNALTPWCSDGRGRGGARLNGWWRRLCLGHLV